MATLLLAYGDPEARDMLRKAIDARYGTQPPALEYLQVGFNGRGKVKFGPIETWVPVEAATYFNFPKAMRWDFKFKALGIPFVHSTEAHDGHAYQYGKGKRLISYTDDDRANQFRKRFWAMSALLLTPLSEPYVKLARAGNCMFSATNTQLNDTVIITLRPDYSVESVQIECLNPDTQALQFFQIRLSQSLCERNTLVLPERMTMYWDDVPHYELEPVHVDFDIRIPSETFRSSEPVSV